MHYFTRKLKVVSNILWMVAFPTLNDEFCREYAFLYPLPKGKFGYKALRNISISPA